jgi:ABC-type amino acid transport substrate-binding protein
MAIKQGKKLRVWLGILWFSASTMVAAESLHVVADHKAMPKNWVENGEAKGIMIDLLSEVTERTGIEFTYEFGTWNRILHLSRTGAGGIIGFSKTEERLAYWDYSVPMYYDELVLVTTKAKQFEFSGLDSLKGKRIAIKRGATYGDDFEKAVEDGLFTLVETEDRTGQMRMMNLDRVDAVLLSPGKMALASVISENEWLREHRDDFVVIQPPFKKDPNFLGIPKQMNKSHLLPKINAALIEIHDDGTYEKIVKVQVDMFMESLSQ